MKFHQLGAIAADENQHMSHLWVKELLGRISSPEFILAIEAYSHVWKTLDEEIDNLEKALNWALGSKNFNERIGGYVSVPERTSIVQLYRTDAE